MAPVSVEKPGQWPLTHEEVAGWLEKQPFKFAKSQSNPHSYIVKSRIPDKRMFDMVVLHIREHGYEQWWWRAMYLQYDANDHCYWTMGGALESTVILNRKSLDRAEEDERLGRGK